MEDWNLLLTTAASPGSEHRVLHELRRFGDFRRAPFKDVCLGWVEDPLRVLEEIGCASAAGEPWVAELRRVIPVESRFRFTPENLAARLMDAAGGLVDRMVDGTFHVRLERRGLLGQVISPEVERAVADRIYELAKKQGKTFHTDFTDPDYIVVAETVNDQCGVALLPRELRERYPFVHPK